MTPLAPRAERLAAVESRPFDLLVVGGGITGAATARDAASRGLSVALVEKADWASGTSWRSSKLVHGGLRYLRSGALALVYESLSERERLLRLAPHLVEPLEFFFAVVPGRWVSRAALAVGLTLYDGLTLGRGASRHRRLGRSAALESEPLLEGSSVSGGAIYSDARADDARLTFENVLDAAALGAVVLSRVAFESPVGRGDGPKAGARLRDVETGRALTARAGVTVRAAGPWSDVLRRAEDPQAAPRIRLSLGAHVTVPASRLPLRRAVAVPVESSRLLFAIPSGPVTLVGTTDTEYTGDPDAAGARRADVAYLLARANEAFPAAALGVEDVVAAFAGLRTLRSGGGAATSRVSREEILESCPGEVSVAGGKLTTHRRMARRAVDAAVAMLGAGGLHAGPSRTADRPFPGRPDGPLGGFVSDFVRRAAGWGIPADSAGHLARRYGSRAEGFEGLLRMDSALARRIVPGLPDIEGEALFGARFEDARSVSDVLIRRTHLFWQAPRQGTEAAVRVAEILRGELGWSAARADSSRADYLSEVARSRDGAGLTPA
ncbi:MAG: glycerol-3-phosphate dehydrogenase/oxidase [Acidobacteriota bacterium]